MITLNLELPPNLAYYAYVTADGGVVELNTCTL
jgi:hypothetical protein